MAEEAAKAPKGFNMTAAMPAEIDRFDWSAATMVGRPDAGMAFFVENPSGTVVVKGSVTVAQELFANEFLREVVGARVPKERIVDFTSNEWTDLKKYCAKAASETDEWLVSRELNRGFITVMEFVKGTPLSALHANPNRIPRTDPLPSHVLRSIGRMIAGDVLLNNWDRVPAIWPHEGNAGNVLLMPSVSRAVALDQAVTGISREAHKEKFDEYMTNAREFLSHCVAIVLRSHGKKGGPGESVRGAEALARSRQFIFPGASHDIKSDFVNRGIERALAQGVVAGLRMAVRCSDADVAALRTRVEKAVRADWAGADGVGVWKSGCEKIDLEFLNATMAIAREVAEALPPEPVCPGDLSGSPAGAEERVARAARVGAECSAFRVAVIQEMPMGPSEGPAFVDATLARLTAEQGTPPEFAMLCEGWFVEDGTVADTSTNKMLAHLCEVAAKHGVYILCGTMMEREASDKYYCTATVVAPDGDVVCCYRKRRQTPGEISQPGQEVAIFETPHGRVGVLICFDIENSDILHEVLAYKPSLLLNPVHIPPPHVKGQTEEGRQLNWYNGQEAMAKKFERIARENNLTIVRCDMASNGTSVGIGQLATTYAPTNRRCVFTTYVERASSKNVLGTAAPDFERSQLEENTGNRYSVRTYLGCDGPVRAVAYKLDEEAAAVSGGVARVVPTLWTADASLRSFDSRAGGLSKWLHKLASPAAGLAHVQDTNSLLCVLTDGTILAWNIADGSARTAALPGVPTCLSQTAAGSPALHLAGTEQGAVFTIDPLTLEAAAVVSGTDPVRCVAWAGDRIVVAHDASCCVQGPDGFRREIAVPSPPSALAVASKEGEPVVLLACRDGAVRVAPLTGPPSAAATTWVDVTMHAAPAVGVAALSDAYFLSADALGNLYLLDLRQRGARQRSYVFHLGVPLVSVRYDGFRIVAVGEDYGVRIIRAEQHRKPIAFHLMLA